MKTILRLLLTAVAVVVLSDLLPGIYVDNFGTAVIVAIVLALLRLLVKPILILLTLPLTILTLGFFLLIVNAIIILMAGSLVGGFHVSSLWWALLFSLLLSLFQSVLFSIIGEKQ